MSITEALPNLPAAVARQTLRTLIAALPPPPAADTAENRAARDEAAIAAVAALHPADAFEAIFAAQIVAANAQAMECLRHAVQPGLDPAAAQRFRAQAAGMMRHMQTGLRMLRRDQAAREKAEAEMHPAAMARAGYWFLIASRYFNYLIGYNRHNHKHYPNIRFGDFGRSDGWRPRRSGGRSRTDGMAQPGGHLSTERATDRSARPNGRHSCAQSQVSRSIRPASLQQRV